MNEEWKSIIRFEGLYEVSSEGRVRSLKWGKTRVLKPGKNRYGYLYVILCKNRENKTFTVHHLVASAFIQNPMCKTDVNHKDENKENNRVDNLEWMTRKENCNYGTRNERVANAISRAVLQFTKEGDFIKEFISETEASRQTGIAIPSISYCLKGKLKSAGGYVWKYKFPR